MGDLLQVFGNQVGVNAYPLINVNDEGLLDFNIYTDVTVEVTDEKHAIAQTQTHHTFMGRGNVIQEATLTEYQKILKLVGTCPKFLHQRVSRSLQQFHFVL